MLVSSPVRFAIPPISSAGLGSLLVVVPPSGGAVVTRAVAAASSRGCCCAGGGVVHEEESRRDGGMEDAIEAGCDDDDEEDGCWVSYGRREPRRRLPPPIPSWGALRRTRTRDGRLVIRTAPVASWRDRIVRARRRGGRLTIQLVEHDGGWSSPMTTLPLPAPTEAETLDEPDDDTPAVGEDGVDEDVMEGEGAVVVEAREEEMRRRRLRPVVPSAGCFEDVVFEYSSVGATSLPHQQLPSLIRMVH